MSNHLELNGVERAFSKLQEISADWKDPLTRDYYVACITDNDGVKKFCFLGEAEVERVYGCKINTRKRYILPVADVFDEISQTQRGDPSPMLLGYIFDQLCQVMESGIGPATNWKCQYGTHAPYRQLCRFAEKLS